MKKSIWPNSPSFLSFFCQKKSPTNFRLPIPDARQIAWQELELLCFVHFNMNTFSDRSGDLRREKPDAVLIQLKLDGVSGLELLRKQGWKELILNRQASEDSVFWPLPIPSIRWKMALGRWEGIVSEETADACGEYAENCGNLFISPLGSESSRTTVGQAGKYIPTLGEINWLKTIGPI